MPENNEINLRSEHVQEILTRVPHWMIRWGSLVILILFVLILFFSYLIRYPDIITTQIVITTEIPPEKLIARSSGKIERILVKDRDHVMPGTPLAIIKNSANYSDILRLKSCLDTLSPEANFFVFPFESFSIMRLGEIQGAYTQFEKDYLAFDINRTLNPYSIEQNSQHKERGELNERYAMLLDQLTLGQKEIEIKKEALERDRKLFESGVISLLECENKNLDYLQQEKSLKGLNSQLSQIRSSVNNLSASAGNSVINEKKDNINLLRNTYHSLALLRKAIDDWELSFVISSSMTGTVSFMQIWVENQTINAGDPVFTVVPSDNKEYIGKVKASQQNAGKIKVGQEVTIHLTNYQDSEFGTVKGKIASISLTPDAEGNLLIDISLPNGIETSYEKQITFQQEMSGTADIITEDLRLIERFFYQFKNLFKR